MNQRIKKLRQTLGLTQKNFGEKIGLKQNSIALIESGKRNMSDTAIIALLSAFPNVNHDWLINGTGEMFIQYTPCEKLSGEFEAFINCVNEETPDMLMRMLCISEIINFSDEMWNKLIKFLVLHCGCEDEHIIDYVESLSDSNADIAKAANVSALVHKMIDEAEENPFIAYRLETLSLLLNFDLDKWVLTNSIIRLIQRDEIKLEARVVIPEGVEPSEES